MTDRQSFFLTGSNKKNYRHKKKTNYINKNKESDLDKQNQLLVIQIKVEKTKSAVFHF